MFGLVKILFRAVFNAHVFALAFVAFVLHGLYTKIGAVYLAPVSFDDWIGVCVVFGVVLALGWLAGNEFRSLQVRTLRNLLRRAQEHGDDMRRLNMTMVDDVLLAARNGLPVKSFPYGGRGTGDELDVAAHHIDRAARAAERAKEDAAFDLSGRL